MKQVIFIGAGPANIFAALQLKKKRKNVSFLILEQGLEINERTDLRNGFGGAGLFSDFKLSVGLDVGGDIGIRDINVLNKKANEVIALLKPFVVAEQKLKFVRTNKLHSLKLTNLEVRDTSVCHIGTNYGIEILKKIQEYLKDHLVFNSEVKFIEKIKDGRLPLHKIIYSQNGIKKEETARHVIIGTGCQSSDFLDHIVKENGIQYTETPKPLQIGARIELPNQNKKLMPKLPGYDFKFIRKFGAHTVRTFCCNSGDAQIVAEPNNGLFVSFNGKANKIPEAEQNNNVNFGVLIDTKPYDYNTQIKLVQELIAKNTKQIFTYEEWKNEAIFTEELKEYFGLINTFFSDFEKEVLIPILGTDYQQIIKFYLPEVKLTTSAYSFDTEQLFKITDGLYFVGDVNRTRGIIKASIQGVDCINYIIDTYF
jgi:uncharacterized FAD-dependent dehydrogenase